MFPAAMNRNSDCGHPTGGDEQAYVTLEIGHIGLEYIQITW